MSSDPKLWHLYCVATKQRITDATQEQVLAHVKTLTDDLWPNWFIWTDEYPDWVPIADCPIIKNSRDRRRFPRVNVRVNVTIVCGFQKFSTFAKDISVGGILLDRELPFIPPRDRVRVILKYADTIGEPIEFNARLIMDREHPIRLEFMSGEEKFRKRLTQWVNLALKRKAG